MIDKELEIKIKLSIDASGKDRLRLYLPEPSFETVLSCNVIQYNKDGIYIFKKNSRSSRRDFTDLVMGFINEKDLIFESLVNIDKLVDEFLTEYQRVLNTLPIKDFYIVIINFFIHEIKDIAIEAYKVDCEGNYDEHLNGLEDLSFKVIEKTKYTMPPLWEGFSGLKEWENRFN